MTTLLMRFRAPMMSWGDHSRFTIRDSRREPTKSAVIGLLCAALGRPRSEPVNNLTALKMGVRIDKPGVIQCDYHTVMDGIKSGGGKGGTVISHRYYIADADYLVGLSDELCLDNKVQCIDLAELDIALQNPRWQLYFGRKSFVPSCPVHILNGLVETDLETALKEHNPPPGRLEYILEVPNSSDVRQDVPVNWQRRLFASRCVDTQFFPLEVA